MLYIYCLVNQSVLIDEIGMVSEFIPGIFMPKKEPDIALKRDILNLNLSSASQTNS